jgi:hypothetical protein
MSGDNKDNIVSGVNHLGFISGRATSNDGMYASLGHRYCSIDPSDSTNAIKKGLRAQIYHIKESYGLYIIMYNEPICDDQFF